VPHNNELYVRLPEIAQPWASDSTDQEEDQRGTPLKLIGIRWTELRCRSGGVCICMCARHSPRAGRQLGIYSRTRQRWPNHRLCTNYLHSCPYSTQFESRTQFVWPWSLPVTRSTLLCMRSISNINGSRLNVRGQYAGSNWNYAMPDARMELRSIGHLRMQLYDTRTHNSKSIVVVKQHESS
jgi:hypothetical protein